MNKKSKPETLCLGFILISALICFIAISTCNTSFSTEDSVQVSSLLNENSVRNDVTADPDGYLNGKWNIWEFVGDFFSNMFE